MLSVWYEFNRYFSQLFLNFLKGFGVISGVEYITKFFYQVYTLFLHLLCSIDRGLLIC